ncbi:hypothetical protein NF681_11270 [Comamonadaceae bacterium OTU4NAUVB1]|nr:hypothetical protein NF681_11270 [Comamonadaceae bacterium OTU4NAUVB1]
MARALVSTQLARTAERFSRVLGQNNPAVRSSTARIVPMATKQRVHPADRIVGWGCAFGAFALVGFACLGWL